VPLTAVAPAEDPVGQVWLVREQTEYEAAMHFALLAGELVAAGFPAGLAQAALRASRDELEHAALCREVVAAHGALAPLPPRRGLRLGPAPLSRWQRAVYQAVALSCITETLSVALLLEMRALARDPPVVAAVGRIVRDESRHSQLGWAVLDRASAAGDVAWLSAHVPAMLRAALDSEELTATDDDLGGHGVLPPARSRAVTDAVVAQVILPGLARHGIDVSAGC